MKAVADQLRDLQRGIKDVERAMKAWHRRNEASRRLATIPGVGVITALAIVATVANPKEFKSARHLAAFLGLTPKEHSAGGRQRVGASGNKVIPISVAFSFLAGHRLCVTPRYWRLGLGETAVGTAASTGRYSRAC
jgi:hypothetical protein